MSADRSCLALYTFGLFSRPADDPANDGFQARNAPIFAVVDSIPGLIARSGYVTDPGTLSWGEQVIRPASLIDLSP